MRQTTITYGSILSLARSGAVARAWDALVASGLAEKTDDPAALTLKGRLLKDQARRNDGETAAGLYSQSAKAYADAAKLRPDSYPLINAASMSLFAGQREHAALLAREVLNLLDTGIGAGETPYWHEATRAEALLLLGEAQQAETALDKAIAVAPTAWEDRAATLRQFREILTFRQENADWLDRYAPPASLYFKGLIGIAPDDSQAADRTIAAVARSGAAFGYGALAAGADILVAEALIDSGGELHVILPNLSSAFRAQSVTPYGDAWVARFDRLFERAALVTSVTSGDRLTDVAVSLAALVAKGAAIENARRLEGRAKGLELNERLPSEFDERTDMFVPLERSAPRSQTPLAKGRMLVPIVTDRPLGDMGSWTVIADGYYVRDEGSLERAIGSIRSLRTGSPDAKIAVCAIADESRSDSDLYSRVLRIAQSATAGSNAADAQTAHALLALAPKLPVEPLGELADAGGAISIYAFGMESQVASRDAID